ncbi:hypothetical protein K466DRAFT_74949 [Polyporus arcularius HHB13444]|uniref:Uncharacterized protein n=1 Tax=Polyporus arcularius HHB13444 TaxID=1314778 RepID=A0A5C3PGH4_9APHY|nr:hypothetical protein K466DRAFT_74949 [Polyporus arcularius HHB13444]
MALVVQVPIGPLPNAILPRVLVPSAYKVPACIVSPPLAFRTPLERRKLRDSVRCSMPRLTILVSRAHTSTGQADSSARTTAAGTPWLCNLVHSQLACSSVLRTLCRMIPMPRSATCFLVPTPSVPRCPLHVSFPLRAAVEPLRHNSSVSDASSRDIEFAQAA